MVDLQAASGAGRGDPGGEEADGGVAVDRRGPFSAVCKWLIPNFSKLKQRTTRCLWSKYFEVGGYDCRLLVYPAGDSQALPGYISIYLQVTDPKNASGKWDCFASYRLCVANQADDAKSVARDSWHRFSAKRKSHGWCDFAQASVVLDPGAGFAVGDTVLVTADILVLSEQTQFAREAELPFAGAAAGAEVLSGKFSWKVHNFGLFREMIKTQKIMSPAFAAGECSLRLSVYQSAVSGTNYLSMCLESKDTEKAGAAERSCWCLFRMSVLTQVQGGRHMHRDSYGRFAADSRTGDNTSLGWNDFMSVASFTDPAGGYFVGDTATFSATFHIIKESSAFNRAIERGPSGAKGRNRLKGNAGEVYLGKFTWKIEHFTRLKELLKRRKITGLCIKSRRFQVGSRDCRLIVYPRGQSQPPNHLSMFLEVTDPSAAAADWSCFVSHRLSVVNQRQEERSVAKESQNRYSKQAKDWGWREFITLTSLFDCDAGFLVNDCVVFAAEVLVLRESSELKALPSPSPRTLALPAPGGGGGGGTEAPPAGLRARFSWRIENFVAFKEIMETRKIFSKFFCVEGCDLRIGVYESFDTLCIYLESDAFGAGPERNFWVKYRIAVLNQRHPERTAWKESSICTKTWNNSVLQFLKVTDMVDPEAGYVLRDGLLLACEVLECQPWFDFADLEVLASDSEAESLSTDPEELLDSEGSDVLTAEEEDIFRSLLGDAGLAVVGAEGGPGVDARDLHQALADRMQMDLAAAASFVAGLRLYLADDPLKVRRLLQSGHPAGEAGEPGVCLLDLLMGIQTLQAPLLDLLLDTLQQLCRAPPRARPAAAAAKLRRQALLAPPEPGAVLLPAFSRFMLEGREDGECASSSSAALPSGDALPPAKPATPLTGNDSSSSGTATPQEPSAPEPAGAAAAAAGAAAAAAAADEAARGRAQPPGAGRERAEELISLALRWLATVDAFAPPGPETEPRAQYAAAAVAKVQALLTELPRSLQAQLVLLVPVLIDASEHTAAAGMLLARLAAAHREGPEAERQLRVPVLTALGRLRIDPAAAEKVLQAALQALASLSEPELPPAAGLVLKLAAGAGGELRTAAVRAVRRRLRARPEVSPGALDAVRLATGQHADVAAALLGEIEADCRAPKGASAEAEAREAPGNGGAMHAADLEVLLDLLGCPPLAERARGVFERGIQRGLLVDLEVAATLEQRRMRQLAAAGSPSPDFLGGEGRGPAPGGSGGPESGGAAALLPSGDDSEAVLGLAEALAGSKQARARLFAATLYQTIFRVHSGESHRGWMLRGLVSRAVAGSALQQAQAKERPGGGGRSGGQPNGKAAHGGRSPRPAAGGKEPAGAAPAEARPEVDVTTPEGLLLALISQYAGAARPAVVLMLLEAQAANAKAAALGKRVTELEGGQDKALREARAAAQREKAAAERAAERLADSEAQVAQLRSEHTTEAAGFAGAKRDLEEKVRNLERELEWVRGEREEERRAMAHERRDTAARLKELEAASTRLKSARRDDLKRVTRERAQALDRCKELEAAQARAEEDARKLKGAAASSAAAVDSLTARLEEAERTAAAARKQRDSEGEEQARRVKELEASLKERTAAAQQLREEVLRVAPLTGANLDQLSAAQLDSLARIHERGLKQAHALLVQRRSEESAAATAVAAANAVTGGGPPPPRSGVSRSPGGGPPARAHSSFGSLDSLISLGLDPPAPAGRRGLAPADRAPGSGNAAVPLSSAASGERGWPDGVPGLQRSLTPGLASFYGAGGGGGGAHGAFGPANAALPNGFPNGLLSGTGLLNGKQSSGNGTHRLW